MLALPSAALLGLALLAAPAETSARAPLPYCETGVHHIELVADTANERFTVCIHPGLSTTLFFDSKLARVELAGRERFHVVLQGDNALTLLPSEALVDGERVRLTVYFQDGAAPTSATFELVVHPSQAEGQVMVKHQPSPVSSDGQDEQQAREELQRCREENARLQAENAGQVGLTGLRAQGLMGAGGVAAKELDDTVTARPGNTLALHHARSYRTDTEHSEGGRKLVRLAVELELWNTGKRPWTPTGAELAGPKQTKLKVLGVWAREPIAPDRRGRVVVEVEATEGEARGPFTLKLWGEGEGARGELFDGVTFP